MSYGDTEPSELQGGEGASPFAPASRVTFDRRELNRESVLVVRGDTLVPGDALLDDADTIEIRPVISGGLG